MTSATLPGVVGLQKATPWSTWHPSGNERLGRRKATPPVWDTGFAATNDDLLPADSLAVRHRRLTATGLGWVAGWSADLLPDGTTRTWVCPTPPGRHEPGDVWTYWAAPSAEIPLGQTMLLAHTQLVRAAGGHGGLPQAEDFLMVNGVTTLAAGELLPHVVYFYRKHPHQMTRGAQFDTFEGPAREFAFRHGQQLRAALAECPRVTSDTARS
ncbi:hypothetical protein ADK70_07945 [Streptomyces rimosus subsp. pseudoverticillatus]|nr:hypothetical protein ADK70_07945 [Streptomyces rimosus subsp. pseudoverticillatus]